MNANPLAALMQDRCLRTAAALKGSWSENAGANRKRVMAQHQVSDLWKDESYKLGVLIAAGPSLKESLAEIKALDRSKCEIVAVDMAYAFLVANGVIPDYVICADANPVIQRTLTADLPAGAKAPILLLNVAVDPATGADWDGDVYWFGMMSNFYDGDRKVWMQQDHERRSGCSSFLVPGGNVGSLGLSFLLGVRSSPKVVLYGHDFCWSADGDFYAGGLQKDLAAERITSERQAGTVFEVDDAQRQCRVLTNASLMDFAGWYRDRMR